MVGNFQHPFDRIINAVVTDDAQTTYRNFLHQMETHLATFDGEHIGYPCLTTDGLDTFHQLVDAVVRLQVRCNQNQLDLARLQMFEHLVETHAVALVANGFDRVLAVRVRLELEQFRHDILRQVAQLIRDKMITVPETIS